MRISRRQFNVGASAAALSALGVRDAFAQQYPSQDIHFICAFPAGSGADVIVRWYSEKLKPITGRNIIVENKVGALGNLALEHVMRSKPDGYTIFVHGAGGVASNQHLFKNPSIDASKAVQMAATINKQPTMLAVHANKPWKSVAELTAFLREKKEKATYATSNPNGRVMGALYKEHAKLEAVEVVYRTASDSMNDMQSGTVDYAVIDNIFGAAQEREGRLRILAVSTGERLQANPQTPTMVEQGVPIRMTAFFSVMVPAATPRPLVDQINKWFNQVTGSADAKKFLNSAASDPWLTTPDQAQAELMREIKDWEDYVRIAKLEKQG